MEIFPLTLEKREIGLPFLQSLKDTRKRGAGRKTLKIEKSFKILSRRPGRIYPWGGVTISLRNSRSSGS
ncbi:MAG: hypothetical protein C6I01_06400, partial [Epsilonproteobacteria bacterium]|nr:hypothetical protein [Campylobacterota bacterium]